MRSIEFQFAFDLIDLLDEFHGQFVSMKRGDGNTQSDIARGTFSSTISAKSNKDHSRISFIETFNLQAFY